MHIFATSHYRGYTSRLEHILRILTQNSENGYNKLFKIYYKLYVLGTFKMPSGGGPILPPFSLGRSVREAATT